MMAKNSRVLQKAWRVYGVPTDMSLYRSAVIDSHLIGNSAQAVRKIPRLDPGEMRETARFCYRT